MQRNEYGVLLSASDLMRFSGCAHATTLDLAHMAGGGPAPGEDSEDAKLLQRHGDAHEARHLAALRAAGRSVVEVDRARLSLAEGVAITRKALAGGAEVVFQGALAGGAWGGWTDFLERVERPSALGDFSYEVADTKLKRKPHPKHVLQLALYSDLLAGVQGVAPEQAHVELGDGTRATIRLAEVAAYARRVRGRLEAFVARPEPTRPVPCADCPLCRWREHCAATLAGAGQPVPRREHHPRPGRRSSKPPACIALATLAAHAGAGARHGRRDAGAACGAGRAPGGADRGRDAGLCAAPGGARQGLRPHAGAGPGRYLLRHRGRPARRGRAGVSARPLGARRGLSRDLGARPGRRARGARRGPRGVPGADCRASGRAHLPLRRLRGDGAAAADRGSRARRGIPRPAAARAALRRSLRGGAGRRARLGARLFDQVARGLHRHRAPGRGEDRRRLGGRLRALARGA